MTRWRALAAAAADPTRVGLAVFGALFTVAVVGLARTVGVEIHPAAGWAVVAVCTGVPAAWLGKRAHEQWITDRAAARRAARGGRTEEIPADMRADGGGQGGQQWGAPPSRDWSDGS